MQSSEMETLNIKGLQQRALELWEVDQASALELGRALIAVRDAMREEHGAFSNWYRENGLEENRVYYCIRRAEGKTAQPAPEPAKISLNKNNLLLAKYAPAEGGRFVAASVRVGPDGTTITDGFVLMRVGLPEGNSCTESVTVPSAFMANITGPAELSFRNDSVSVTTGDITQTTKSISEFPPTERIWDANPACQDKVPESGVAFEINVHHLSQILKALNEVAEKDFGATAKISVRPSMLRVDYRRNDGQTFEGFMKTRQK